MNDVKMIKSFDIIKQTLIELNKRMKTVEIQKKQFEKVKGTQETLSKAWFDGATAGFNVCYSILIDKLSDDELLQLKELGLWRS
jgi:hypothetical protein